LPTAVSLQFVLEASDVFVATVQCPGQLLNFLVTRLQLAF